MLINIRLYSIYCYNVYYFKGKTCENGTYGVGCFEQCGHCTDQACSTINGTCLSGCNPGFLGHLCKTRK